MSGKRIVGASSLERILVRWAASVQLFEAQFKFGTPNATIGMQRKLLQKFLGLGQNS